MKLTKKLEAEVLKVYHTYWDSYTAGDIKTFAGILDRTFELIGTSASEICHTRKEGIKFLKAQVKELGGKVEMRNRKISVVPVQEVMLVNERCDIYTMDGREWRFYSKIRISTFLRKTVSGWKVFHQHGSFPDLRVQEGETLAVKKISQENLQLRDAIKRRTIELEQKNRELEIETALERVRAKTMAMHKASELQGVIHTVHQELLRLNIGISGGSFIVINSAIDKELHCWGSGGTADTSDEIHIPYYGKRFYTTLVKGIKKGPGFFTESYSQKEKKEFFTFLFKHEPWSKLKAKEKKETLSGPGGYTRSCCVSRHTSIFIINHFGEKFSAADNEILKRFGKVFEQAYTRFLDLQNAEAQVREAQIEAALEKVRSRSLAMHKSDELNQVVTVLFEKLKELHIPVTAVGITTFLEGSKDMNVYVCGDVGKGLSINHYLLPYFDHRIANEYYDVYKKQRELFIGKYSKEEKNSFYKKVFKLEALKDLPVEVKSMVFKSDSYTITMAGAKNSMLAVNNFDGEQLSESEIEVIKRFAKVFDQAYIRFLDLKKAEAQAREAQIEAALEKVRSRSLAMHKSDELKEVVAVLYRKLQELDFDIDKGAAVMMTFSPGSKDHTQWITDATQTYAVPFYIPFTKHTISLDQVNARKKELPFYSRRYSRKEKNEHFRYLFRHTQYSQLPEPVKRMILDSKDFGISIAFEKNSAIAIPSAIEKLVTGEEINILKRFSRVFEQSYTRFLDLQKAEAQAREAQIEAALERTRTQSMLMQHSDELRSTANVFHEQLKLLGIDSEFSYLWLPDEEKANHLFWATWDETENGKTVIKNKAVTYPLDKTEPSIAACYVAWESGEPIHVNPVPPAGIKNYFATWSELLGGIEKFKPKYFKNGLYYIDAYMKYGCFGIVVRKELTDDEKKILRRFTIEFERTYTRFLDLQKAEAQAREAQIETALEKVRSRSLAMHKSDELLEVVTVIFEQLKNLGLQLWSCGIVRFHSKQSSEAEVWMTRPDGKMMGQSFVIPLDKVPVYKKLYEAWKNMEEFHIESLQDMDIIKHHNSIALLNVIPVDKMKQAAGRELPRQMFFHCINYSDGFLGVITTEAVEDETLLLRFGNTFKQSYTRFLDLQKAEAQAREAKIEMALEKIRSRTMAMQHSDELPEAANLLFLEVQALGIPAWSCGYNVLAEDKKTSDCWMSSEGAIQEPFNLYFTEEASFIEWYSFIQSDKDFFVQELGGEALVQHYNYMRNIPRLGEVIKKLEDAGISLPTYQINHLCKFSYGFLLFITYEPVPDAHDLFKRFTKVFEQTYTRFLDLQKAEAQAREAQIEAALERVRSRTMAMHQSRELNDAAELLYQELSKLGIEKLTCGFTLLDDKSGTGTCYMANPEGSFVWEPFRLNHTGSPVFELMYKSWKKQEPYHLYELTGRVNIDHNKFLAETADNFPIPAEQLLAILPPVTYSNSFNFRYGYLLVVSLAPIRNEHCHIISRFARVFEQTYTRFLDLQKAEAQAREAQIETALEKVRSRSLAMQQPDELLEVAELIREEMGHLGVEELETSSIYLVDKENRQAACWYAIKDIREGNKKLVSDEMTLFLPDTRVGSEMWTFYQSGKEQASLVMKGEDRKEWINYCASRSPVLQGYYGNEIPERTYHLVKFNGGYMGAASPGDISAESWDLLKRAAAVFSFAYTRFKDLQDAAARTREAQIELALERVRSQAMAMRQSADLLDIVVTMRNEFTKLGHEAHYFWYMRWLPDKYEKAMTSGDGTRIGMVMTLPRHIHGDIKLVADWEKSDAPTLVFAMDVDTAVDYVGKMISLGDFEQVDPQAPTLDDIRQIGGLTFIMARTLHGEIGYSLPGVVSDPPAEDIKTLVRFAGVFDLAYRRFEDLKLAEQKNRETEIELALEKVRSRTMAMQKSEELGDVATVLFKELNVLVKNLWTCGFVLCERNRSEDEWWISTESGFIPAFYLPNTGDITHENIYQGWLNGEIYHTEQLEGEALQRHYDWLMTLPVAKKIFDDLAAAGYEKPEWQKLHCAYFSRGYLCIITREPCAEEEIFKRFASVFDLTYTRFLDLQRAEAQARQAEADLIAIKVARQKAEEALTELKAAQAQLVQSEKMASLGELTAGIAHEIQNPLNFVNNFSEVSKELLDEMKEELEKGHVDNAREIMDDIIQNLEKINHHGKRADGIVKGMLQHSRSSSGVKEPTDINALADEYLRLAYHGLRAKDKGFNAAMKTDFDPAIGEINMVPQDIGRVILNLITNAFYAVGERKKLDPEGYAPEVTVSTQQSGNSVILKVKDNGTGIPQPLIEKIFQPFFTTKPTGQGTGLGLSLSYDIVKAQGGELKVETKHFEGLPAESAGAEQAGTTFIIELPLK